VLLILAPAAAATAATATAAAATWISPSRTWNPIHKTSFLLHNKQDRYVALGYKGFLMSNTLTYWSIW
jgi:hypothetical protein